MLRRKSSVPTAITSLPFKAAAAPDPQSGRARTGPRVGPEPPGQGEAGPRPELRAQQREERRLRGGAPGSALRTASLRA